MNLILVPTSLELNLLRLSSASSHVEMCGFGMAVAGARAAQLIHTLPDGSVRHVILVGIAGSYGDTLSVGSAYRFTRLGCYGVGVGAGTNFETAGEMGWAQWDASGSRIGDELSFEKEAIEERDADGLLLTVSAASANEDDCRMRRRKFPDVVAEDMEAFSVGVACQLAGLPLTVVRGISNQAGQRDHGTWKVEQAMQSASDLVNKILDQERRT